MNDLAHIATIELERFLSEHLPKLSGDWWQERVLGRLTKNQRETALNRNHVHLEDLDLAALLRVLDQNWIDLSDEFQLNWDGKTWTNELKSARNRWAHASAKAVPAREVYRDAETLTLLLEVLGASSDSLEKVEKVRNKALADMAPKAPKRHSGETVARETIKRETIVRETPPPARFTGAGMPVRQGYGSRWRGKYTPLQEALQARGSDEWEATFREIEEIIGDLLPPSARKWPVWWANDANPQHSQKRAWGGAGWYIGSVSLIDEIVVFRRMK